MDAGDNCFCVAGRRPTQIRVNGLRRHSCSGWAACREWRALCWFALAGNFRGVSDDSSDASIKTLKPILTAVILNNEKHYASSDYQDAICRREENRQSFGRISQAHSRTYPACKTSN